MSIISQEAKVNSQEEKLKKMISILKSASTESSDEGKMIKNLKDIKLNNTDADFEILQTTYSDNNILIYALDNGYVTLTEKIVELCNTNFPSRLIEFLNTKNSKGETGLHFAAYRGKKYNLNESVRLLLVKGANPNIQDNAGETPMHRCAMNLTLQVFRELRGSPIINIDLRDNQNKRPYNVIGKCNSSASADLKEKFEEELKGSPESLAEDDKFFSVQMDPKYLIPGKVILHEGKKPKVIFVSSEDKKLDFSVSDDQSSFRVETNGILNDGKNIPKLYLKIEITIKGDTKEFDIIGEQKNKDDCLFYFPCEIQVHRSSTVKLTISVKNEKYKNIQPYEFKCKVSGIDDEIKKSTKRTLKKIVPCDQSDTSEYSSSISVSDDEIIDETETEQEEEIRLKEQNDAKKETNAVGVRDIIEKGEATLWGKIGEATKNDTINEVVVENLLIELWTSNGGNKISAMPLYNYKSEIMNILHRAAWYGKRSLVERILRYTNDINAKTDEHTVGGKTALSIAASFGHYEIVEILLIHPFNYVPYETFKTIREQNRDSNELLDQYFEIGSENEVNFNLSFGRKFDGDKFTEFWSEHYPKLRNIFAEYDSIEPFPMLNVMNNIGETAIFHSIQAVANHDNSFKCLRVLMELSFVRLCDNYNKTLFNNIAISMTKQSIGDEGKFKRLLQKLRDYGVSKYPKGSDQMNAFSNEKSPICGMIQDIRPSTEEIRYSPRFKYKKFRSEVRKKKSVSPTKVQVVSQEIVEEKVLVDKYEEIEEKLVDKYKEIQEKFRVLGEEVRNLHSKSNWKTDVLKGKLKNCLSSIDMLIKISNEYELSSDFRDIARNNELCLRDFYGNLNMLKDFAYTNLEQFDGDCISLTKFLIKYCQTIFYTLKMESSNQSTSAQSSKKTPKQPITNGPQSNASLKRTIEENQCDEANKMKKISNSPIATDHTDTADSDISIPNTINRTPKTQSCNQPCAQSSKQVPPQKDSRTNALKRTAEDNQVNKNKKKGKNEEQQIDAPDYTDSGVILSNTSNSATPIKSNDQTQCSPTKEYLETRKKCVGREKLNGKRRLLVISSELKADPSNADLQLEKIIIELNIIYIELKIRLIDIDEELKADPNNEGLQLEKIDVEINMNNLELKIRLIHIGKELKADPNNEDLKREKLEIEQTLTLDEK